MRKRIMGMISLGMVVCLALAGCGKEASGKETPEVAQQQDTPEVVQQAAEGEETEQTTPEVAYTEQTTPEVAYTTQEIWVQNGDNRIYGVAYIPASEADRKLPLVIFSHELGNDHTSGERYAQRLAEAGYAAYILDFCGGTVGGNRSDGSNNEMSV